MQSRLLIGLTVVQAGLLLWLVARVISIEEKIAVSEPTPAVTPSAKIYAAAPQHQPVKQHNTFPDESELRNIIREELSAFATPTEQQSLPAKPPPQYSDENRYQLEHVSQLLDYYSSAGTIPAGEMEKLQMEIAKLHPKDRQKMMSRFARSMNSGEINGRL